MRTNKSGPGGEPGPDDNSRDGGDVMPTIPPPALLVLDCRCGYPHHVRALADLGELAGEHRPELVGVAR